MVSKLRSTTGAVSRREALLTVLIVCMLLFFGYEFMNYLKGQQQKGDDALRATTAESVAKVNSNDGAGCPVRGCGNSSGSCVHYVAGEYIGYYDDVSNTIVARKPFGYNEYGTMKINGEVWHGKPKTMVIRVVTGNNDVKLNWELGRVSSGS